MVLSSDLVDDLTRDPGLEVERVQPTSARRRRWAIRALRSAVTLSALGAFVAVERTVRGGKPNAFDLEVVDAMGRSRRGWLTVVAKTVTFFGGVVGASGISLVAFLASKRRPRVAAQIALGSAGGIVAELALKRRFVRARPTRLRHLEAVHSTSFPSGHSMAASCIYLTLAYVASRSRRLRGHRVALLGGASVLAWSIGATRVYLGVHWPTDVLGGLALGTAWASATEAIFDWTGAAEIEASGASVALGRLRLWPTERGAPTVPAS